MLAQEIEFSVRNTRKTNKQFLARYFSRANDRNHSKTGAVLLQRKIDSHNYAAGRFRRAFSPGGWCCPAVPLKLGRGGVCGSIPLQPLYS
jgi:hypothetical protein